MIHQCHKQTDDMRVARVDMSSGLTPPVSGWWNYTGIPMLDHPDKTLAMAGIAYLEQDRHPRLTASELNLKRPTFGLVSWLFAEKNSKIIIDFPNLGITYNGGWCSATMTR